MPEGIVDSHIIDQKFRKHFEFEILLLAHVLHVIQMRLINHRNKWLRHITLDKYPKTNFSCFSVSIPSTLNHTSRHVSEVSRVSLQTTQSIRHDISIRKLINPPSVTHRCEHDENLTSAYTGNGLHRPPTPISSPLASTTPNFQLLALSPLLATRKLAKVAVAVLAENSSLKKIQAITSGSSLEAGGREVGVTAHRVGARGDSIVLGKTLLRSEKQRRRGGEERRTKENEAAAVAVAAVATAAAVGAAEVEEKVKVENSEGGGGLKVAGQSLTLFLCSY